MPEPQPIPSLADVIEAHMYQPGPESTPWWWGCSCKPVSYHVGDYTYGQHIADAYWAARTVHDRETLDALPNLTGILDRKGRKCEYDEDNTLWSVPGMWETIQPKLPAKVLWLPGEGEQ